MWMHKLETAGNCLIGEHTPGGGIREPEMQPPNRCTSTSNLGPKQARRDGGQRTLMRTCLLKDCLSCGCTCRIYVLVSNMVCTDEVTMVNQLLKLRKMDHFQICICTPRSWSWSCSCRCICTPSSW